MSFTFSSGANVRLTIVTRDEIARYGWQTLEDLLRHVPGFFLLDNTEDRFIGTRGAVGGGVQFLVNGIAQHPSRQKTLTRQSRNQTGPIDYCLG